MNRLTDNEVKRIQLEILDVTVAFCEKHHIQYFLDSGTLIGAVRHNGYIPWDDDIDLGMLRNDYDKFLLLFNKENERYKAYSVENNRQFYYPFIKVLDTSTILYEPDENGLKLSINIDVFPYDAAPETIGELKCICEKRNRLRKWANRRLFSGKPQGNAIRRILVYCFRLLFKIIPKWYFVLRIATNAKSYTQNTTSKVSNFTGYAVYSCDRKSLSETVYHVFEGKEYRIPKGYDECLTAIYGDYMKLPPKEKQVSHHTYVAYSDE